MSTGQRDEGMARKVLLYSLHGGAVKHYKWMLPDEYARMLEAQAKLNGSQPPAPQPPPVPPQKVTPWTERYETWRGLKAVVARQQANLERYGKLLGVTFGEKPVEAITHDDVLTVVRKMHDAELSTGTQKHVLNAAKGFFAYCVRSGLITANPAEGVKATKTAARRGVAFSVAEAKRLLALCRGDWEAEYEREKGSRPFKGSLTKQVPQWLYRAVLLALKTGMRRANVMALRWSAVDLAQRKITVQAEDAKARTRLDVPICEELLAVLKAWREADPKCEWVIGCEMGWSDGPWKNALKRAELKDRRFHDTRHTVSSWLSDAGVPLQVAVAILGHSPGSLGVHGRYAHPRWETLLEAVDKLPRLL